MEYPRLSAKCGHEILGSSFHEPHSKLPREIYRQTYFTCQYNEIQVSTFIEHRARLAILKNAVDYKLYKDAGDELKTKEKAALLLGKEILLTDWEMLPSSFLTALEQISSDEYFPRYPVFWQTFLWLFGGFILLDYRDQEYELLSTKTGIPVEKIDEAFLSYQLLFPMDGGWFQDLRPNSNIRVLKMFSVPFKGVGANYRRLIYTKSKKYDDLKIGGTYTREDLGRWNNTMIRVLR